MINSGFYISNYYSTTALYCQYKRHSTSDFASLIGKRIIMVVANYFIPQIKELSNLFFEVAKLFFFLTDVTSP